MTTTYSDYLRDRTGWFFGLTGLQLTLLALGGLPVWLTVNAARWSWLLLWVPVWLLSAFLVVVPVRGWTAAQWIGVLAGHGIGGAMGWTRWQSKVAAGIADDLDLVDLPGVLAGIEIHSGTAVRTSPHHGSRSSRTTLGAPGRPPPSSSIPGSD